MTLKPQGDPHAAGKSARLAGAAPPAERLASEQLNVKWLSRHKGPAVQVDLK